MKILLVHNKYNTLGGEDEVFQAEKELLASHGHEIFQFVDNNSRIQTGWHKIIAFINSPFNIFSYRKLVRILLSKKPDVVHVHNYFPLISPSVFFACKRVGVPVVHTLHNFRAVCPTSVLMYQGAICERSVKHSSLWALPKKVYRNSFFGSLSLVAMIELHKKIGTWRKNVDQYIALTEHAKDKYVEAGWPDSKISVKPNFVRESFKRPFKYWVDRRYALYVGRLSEEKGIETLISAWYTIEFPLKIVGEGPLSLFVEKSHASKIEYLGRRSKEEVLDLINGARFLVVPSICFEMFGMVVVEAFSLGVPVLASNIGGLKSLIQDGRTGLLFEAGSSSDLASKVSWALSHQEEVCRMGNDAQTHFRECYGPDKNYEMLMEIYVRALARYSK